MIRSHPPTLMACGCDEVVLDLKVILAEGKLSEEATCKAWMPGPGTRPGWYPSGVLGRLGDR